MATNVGVVKNHLACDARRSFRVNSALCCGDRCPDWWTGRVPLTVGG
jgi:hypothetical protein